MALEILSVRGCVGETRMGCEVFLDGPAAVVLAVRLVQDLHARLCTGGLFLVSRNSYTTTRRVEVTDVDAIHGVSVVRNRSISSPSA